MSLFSKTKKYRKPSRDIDEKVKSLNKELEKTGLIVEVGPANSTKHVYNTYIYHPATDMEFSDVPDPSGVRAAGWTQPSNGYDASDSSTWANAFPNTDWLYNPNEVGGETNKPVVTSADTPPTGQTIGRFGPGGGLIRTHVAHGSALGYLKSDNTYQGILWASYWGGMYEPTESNRYGSGAPYRGYTDAEYSFMQSAYSKMQASTFNIDVKFWYPYSYFWYGNWDTYGGTKKESGGSRWVLVNGSIAGNPNTYQSQDNAPPYHEVLNRYGLGDDSYYPGDVGAFIAWLRGKLELSDQGWASLEDELIAATYGGKKTEDDMWDAIIKKMKDADLGGPADDPFSRKGTGMGDRWKGSDAGGGGDYDVATYSGMHDIDGRGWFVTGDQLRKMQQYPERYNLSPGELKLIQRLKVQRKNLPIGLDVAHHKPQGELIKEGWVSPKHTDVNKDEKKRWFNPKDIQPEYPNDPPPEMVNGYSEKMFPKLDTPIPYIKVKRKDLMRAHKLKKHEAQEYVDLVNRLNDYIKRNPHRLAYIRERYPKSDPRLAELNYKMDMQIAASDEYLDTQFPENQRLYNKLVKATKRSIKLTDPKTYKDKKGKMTSYEKLLRVDYVVSEYSPEEKDIKNRKIGYGGKKKSAGRFFRKPKKKSKDDILKDKMAVLDKEMKKTMPDQ